MGSGGAEITQLNTVESHIYRRNHFFEIILLFQNNSLLFYLLFCQKLSVSVSHMQGTAVNEIHRK